MRRDSQRRHRHRTGHYAGNVRRPFAGVRCVRVLHDAGYFDFTDFGDRNPANYPRPRTAKRKRCPKAGQASLLDAQGVSDDR
ncbi:hypothetical protein [Pseudodesulfovibrio profundus]|uniref:hypothetical protein n=1 Tax=Pseudodesulfovibrio profundus TaxID=57320 RepID=UPI0012FF7246|nr:hypothetical protein [Pseudodesulfovibrio profundus]